MNEIKDCRGVAIKTGDTIVYPGRKGSSLWLNIGTVLEHKIAASRGIFVQKNNTGTTVEVRDLSRVAVVASGL